MPVQIQLRRGTASQWTSGNPTLAQGEIGVETDTGQFKVGTGSTAWTSLSYGGLLGPTGPTGPTGAASTVTGPTGPTGPAAAALSGGTVVDSVVRGLEEDVNVVAAAASGTVNFNIADGSVWYYTSNATANHTLNFRYNSGISLDTSLATGDAITLVWLNTNGATPYYPNAIQIDGNSVTPKVPAAITGGNANAIDAYSFTIIKTGAATFTVLETQTKFA